MPGSAGRWPASLCGGINAVAGQRPALPFGSFPGEAWQGAHRLFQPLQMQLVFRAAAEAQG
ncbi:MULTISPECIES: hypothetical protein [Stenotrophomonas]|nr:MULTISPECIES: hypothetical protein [Stenotrophomonas]SSM86378.1 Uncharacterised protein [Acinetobacter baumannii]EKT4066434.1 hypothetical protein [Stenotrophomonas maltophilia]KYK42588.1 hypothetical protein AYX08_02785 [Stenotrophomonas maltophilia]MCF3536902.1 hypothetical protein [Stenotrophomonas maltophilia]MCI1063046.1 hypothetical protein [Stenotrophomonas maltophilia]